MKIFFLKQFNRGRDSCVSDYVSAARGATSTSAEYFDPTASWNSEELISESKCRNLVKMRVGPNHTEVCKKKTEKDPRPRISALRPMPPTRANAGW
jgi:hypothetical protein